METPHEFVIAELSIPGQIFISANNDNANLIQAYGRKLCGSKFTCCFHKIIFILKKYRKSLVLTYNIYQKANLNCILHGSVFF